MLNLLAFFPAHWFLVRLEPERWIDDKKLDHFLDEAFEKPPQPGGINETLSENTAFGTSVSIGLFSLILEVIRKVLNMLLILFLYALWASILGTICDGSDYV